MWINLWQINQSCHKMGHKCFLIWGDWLSCDPLRESHGSQSPHIIVWQAAPLHLTNYSLSVTTILRGKTRCNTYNSRTYVIVYLPTYVLFWKQSALWRSLFPALSSIQRLWDFISFLNSVNPAQWVISPNMVQFFLKFKDCIWCWYIFW